MPTASIQPEIPPRLPFVLPEFTRVSWVSDSVRETWEPRLARVNRAWRQLEWASAAIGLRRSALLWLSSHDRDAHVEQWRSHRLSALSLIASPGRQAMGGLTITVVARQLDDVYTFREAWQTQDHDTIGLLLGYPRCCRLMFSSFWSSGATDPTWAMACATEGVQRTDRIAIVAGEDNANILWRWLGIRAVAHLPCSFACTETAHIGESILRLGGGAGLAQDIAWLREVLSWPVEYSALHGIAEIKTPILRIATRTDATAEKYAVTRHGPGFPEGTPRGLHFPYRAAVPIALRRQITTRSEQASAPVTKAKWYFKDNGFQSLVAMRKAHRPLVELACQTIRVQTGNVLDLGSGNAALLAAICARCPQIRPFGVDINSETVKHAPAVLQELPEPQAAVGAVRHGDLFDATTWQDRDYVLAILMLGRLEERQKDAETLLLTLNQHCSTLLVYLYPDWNHFSLRDLAANYGLTLDPTHQVRTSGVQAAITHLRAQPIIPSGTSSA